MQVFNVYSIRVWNGGNGHNHKFYLTSETQAELYKKNNEFDMVVPTTIELFDTIKEFEEWDQGEVRRKVLARLTAVERRALGF